MSPARTKVRDPPPPKRIFCGWHFQIWSCKLRLGKRKIVQFRTWYFLVGRSWQFRNAIVLLSIRVSPTSPPELPDFALPARTLPGRSAPHGLDPSDFPGRDHWEVDGYFLDEGCPSIPWDPKGSCQFLANFCKISLVLGCIKTKFCKKICVWQHFSSFTRSAYFCTAAISKF